jgi:hypothetical protein
VTRRRIDRTADTAIAQAPPGDDNTLLTTAGVAEWLGVSTQWLELGRCKGFGPPYVKVTSRLVRYRRGDVVEYLRIRRVVAETARVTP